MSLCSACLEHVVVCQRDLPKTRRFLDVVKQEMLHLGLAGNILCSIGGAPRVYGNEYTPKYPREIFYEPVEMNLLPGTKDTIHTFMKVGLEIILSLSRSKAPYL